MGYLPRNTWYSQIQVITNSEVNEALRQALANQSSLSGNGWTRLPNGLLLQWGKGAGAGKKYFPIPFNECFSVAASFLVGGDLNRDNQIWHDNVSIWGYTQTYIRYIAVGR